MDPLAVNLKEAAEAIGVSIPTLRHEIEDGKLRARQIRRRWIISKAALREYIGDKEQKDA